MLSSLLQVTGPSRPVLAKSAPLGRQLLMAGLITRLLEDRGKPDPVGIGGLALKRIEKAERDDFIFLGFRTRRVRVG